MIPELPLWEVRFTFQKRPDSLPPNDRPINAVSPAAAIEVALRQMRDREREEIEFLTVRRLD